MNKQDPKQLLCYKCAGRNGAFRWFGGNWDYSSYLAMEKMRNRKKFYVVPTPYEKSILAFAESRNILKVAFFKRGLDDE